MCSGAGTSEVQDSIISIGVGRLASQISASLCVDGEETVGRVEALLGLRGCGMAELQGASGSRGDSAGSEGCRGSWMVGCLAVRGLMMSELSSEGGFCG